MGTDDTTWHARGACELSRLAPPGPLLGTLMLAALIATLACHSGPADAQQPVGTAGTAPPGAAVAVPARQLREFSVTAYCTGEGDAIGSPREAGHGGGRSARAAGGIDPPRRRPGARPTMASTP